MNILELERIKRRIQKKIKLLDWDISISFGTSIEMPDNLGEVTRELQTQTAHIRILQEPDCHIRASTTANNTDIEHTVFHEMLHVLTTRVFKGIEEERVDDVEYVINCLASAFLDGE